MVKELYISRSLRLVFNYPVISLLELRIRIWEVVLQQEIAILIGHQGHVGCVAFRLENMTWEVDISGHTDIVVSLAFREDGQRLATGRNDNTVRIWI